MNNNNSISYNASAASLGEEDDLDQFYDAATFSFGSYSDVLSLPDMDMGGGGGAIAAAGVKFNPMVSIMGSDCEIPLAAGDGFWDTLQYERLLSNNKALFPSGVGGNNNLQGSVSSLSLGDDEAFRADFLQQGGHLNQKQSCDAASAMNLNDGAQDQTGSEGAEGGDHHQAKGANGQNAKGLDGIANKAMSMKSTIKSLSRRFDSDNNDQQQELMDDVTSATRTGLNTAMKRESSRHGMALFLQQQNAAGAAAANTVNAGVTSTVK